MSNGRQGVRGLLAQAAVVSILWGLAYGALEWMLARCLRLQQKFCDLWLDLQVVITAGAAILVVTLVVYTIYTLGRGPNSGTN